MSLIRNASFWIVQDGTGSLWKVTIEGFAPKAQYLPRPLFTFHAGAITGLACAPNDHVVATCGMDGTVRLHDYIKRTTLYITQYNMPATCLLWDPLVRFIFFVIRNSVNKQVACI